MGAALYIVLDREVAGFNATEVCGKAIGSNYEVLEELAHSVGVRSLGDFVSISESDAADMFGDNAPEDVSGETWFEAADGIASVRQLLQTLSSTSSEIPNLNATRSDLQTILNQLELARGHGAKFHVAMDV